MVNVQIHIRLKLMGKCVISLNLLLKGKKNVHVLSHFFPYREEGYIHNSGSLKRQPPSPSYYSVSAHCVMYNYLETIQLTFIGHHLDGKALKVALSVHVVSSLEEPQDHI